MAKKSIEDVLNEIEDFLDSCKTSALSSNKVILPRDEFDELFGDLKVKIPAEIDRCKKIMRNKEAILMDARKTADGMIAQANQQVNLMLSETEIMNQANQKAYETVEMARAQANDIINQATAEANEIRLGSMQYTNDIMMGIRNYVEATMEAERANYENLLTTLNNEYVVVNANLDEIQNQIVDFTGDVNSVTRPPMMKTIKPEKQESPMTRNKPSMVDKVKKAVGVKEAKEKQPEKPVVNIPDFIATGEKVVPNETPLKSTAEQNASLVNNADIKEMEQNLEVLEDDTKKIKKKIVKKRNPVMNTPHTAHETVARTLQASENKGEKTVYKANGEQARAVSLADKKKSPIVNRVKSNGYSQLDDVVEIDTSSIDQISTSKNSMGVIDDFDMDKKF